MPSTAISETVLQLLDTAHSLGHAGFFPATDGNISARIAADRILITKSHVEKGVLTEDQLLEVDLNDNRPFGASSEWLMHQALYNARTDTHCILHVHSPYLTAFACAHRIPAAALLAESAMELAPIVLVRYQKPGSLELARSFMETDPTAGVYLLANHGAVAVGSDILSARYRIERAEFLAKVECLATLMGGARIIKDDELCELMKSG